MPPTTYQTLPLDALYPSPHNPRALRADDPAIAELAQSIREIGLLQPLVVRHVVGGTHEILAGHRRFAAAGQAALAAVPCHVIDPCDDRRALEITVVENLQRQDLSPLEEARGVGALLDGGWALDDIAQHLGKSPRWVTLRAKLRDLSPAWRTALADGKHAAVLGSVPAGALELIARHPETDQDEVLRRLTDDECYRPEQADYTVKEWETYLDEKFLRTLSGAKWDLDDATLVPAAGACSACPLRSSCQQTLFAAAKSDRCTSSACWEAKLAAWTARRAEELRAKHPELTLATTAWATAEERALPRISDYSNQLRPAKKSDPGAKPVLVVDGKQAGQLVWAVTPQAAARAAKGDRPAKAKSSAVKRGEARARWLGARAKVCVRLFGEWLRGEDKRHPTTQPAAPGLVTSMLYVAACTPGGSISYKASYEFEELSFDAESLSTVEQRSIDAKLGHAWQYAAQRWAQQMPPESATLDVHADAWETARTLAQELGLTTDIARIEDTARAEVPIPKSLAPFFDAQTGEPLSDAPHDAKAAKPAQDRKSAQKATTAVTPKAKAKAKKSAKTVAKKPAKQKQATPSV